VSEIDRAAQALAAARQFYAAALSAIRPRVSTGGRLDPALLDRSQRLVHGLAWVATQVAALEATLVWAERQP